MWVWQNEGVHGAVGGRRAAAADPLVISWSTVRDFVTTRSEPGAGARVGGARAGQSRPRRQTRR